MVLSGLMVAVPLAGGLGISTTVKASPSGSVSLAKTGMATGVSGVVEAVSSLAMGASFTSSSMETTTQAISVSCPSVIW